MLDTKNILLEIQNLEVKINKKLIFTNLNLSLYTGAVHVLMGPNGAGKSTLTRVLTRDQKFTISKGIIRYKTNNLLLYNTEKCSLEGIFLAFQYPIELPGILNLQFLKLIYNTHCKYKKKTELDTLDFLKLIKTHMEDLNIQENFLYRSVNFGLSGGEKKKNEILQIALLEPKLIILDEIDSGLDSDSLQNVATKINKIKKTNQTILLITHYSKILQYIKPNYVHILDKGKIIKTGDYTTALDIEKYGYL